MAAVFIVTIHAVSRHFIAFFVHQYGYGAMLQTGIYCAVKKLFHLFRRGRSRDVPVLRCTPEKCVAHASAHSVGIVAFLLQTVDNLIHMFR